MILADTSIWIEFFKKKEPFFSELREHIESGRVVVHGLIFAELLQGSRNRAENDVLLNYWQSLSDDESNSGLIEGGRLSFEGKLLAKGIGIVDAIVIAEARRRKARIWTLDKKMQSFLSRAEYV